MKPLVFLVGIEYRHTVNLLPGVVVDLYRMYRYAKEVMGADCIILTDVEGDESARNLIRAILDSGNTDGLLNFISTVEARGELIHWTRDLDLDPLRRAMALTRGRRRVMFYFTGHGENGNIIAPDHSQIPMLALLDTVRIEMTSQYEPPAAPPAAERRGHVKLKKAFFTPAPRYRTDLNDFSYMPPSNIYIERRKCTEKRACRKCGKCRARAEKYDNTHDQKLPPRHDNEKDGKNTNGENYLNSREVMSEETKNMEDSPPYNADNNANLYKKAGTDNFVESNPSTSDKNENIISDKDENKKSDENEIGTGEENEIGTSDEEENKKSDENEIGTGEENEIGTSDKDENKKSDENVIGTGEENEIGTSDEEENKKSDDRCSECSSCDVEECSSSNASDDMDYEECDYELLWICDCCQASNLNLQYIFTNRSFFTDYGQFVRRCWSRARYTPPPEGSDPRVAFADKNVTTLSMSSTSDAQSGVTSMGGSPFTKRILEALECGYSLPSIYMHIAEHCKRQDNGETGVFASSVPDIEDLFPWVTRQKVRRHPLGGILVDTDDDPFFDAYPFSYAEDMEEE
jgi:hypothetical protein